MKLNKNILKVVLVTILAFAGVSAAGIAKVTDLFDMISPIEFNVVKTTKNVSTSDISDKSVAELIESIEISDQEGNVKYDRNEWEKPAKKFNGKSIRNYTLSISPNNISQNDVFEFVDPYTNEIVDNVKMIDYDHIIPLSYVHRQAGYKWSSEQKHEYAFNIDNGVNTHRAENRGKGAKGPSEYLPPVNQVDYCYSWLVVANHYKIPLKKADMDVIKDVLQDAQAPSIINPYL